jgi:hypothetical protein
MNTPENVDDDESFLYVDSETSSESFIEVLKLRRICKV